MRKQGCAKEEAEDTAIEFCRECNPPYDEEEALRTVESAYGYKAQPWRTLGQPNYYREASHTEEGEPEYKIKPLTFDQVSDKVAMLLDGMVANVHGELVQLPTSPEEDAIPFKTTADLFSYLGRVFKDVPDWKKGSNFMSKEELFSSLKVELPHLSNIEKMPHYPYLKDCHYALPELPEADMTVLDEFLVTSKDGRGVGKSTLAETAAKLLNQVPIQASTRLDSDGLTTRLLSPEGMKSRIVLFDNEVGTQQKISNDGMASLFTTSQISGRKLYAGEGSRPNNLVWIMTLNSVTLDSDFASRCIPIALKKPEGSVNWQERLNSFIEENRWILIATMLELLASKTEHYAPKNRWGLWENQVLSKVPGLDRNTVLELISSRQRENDNDLDEKVMIIDAIMNLINAQAKDMKTHRFFIGNSEMAELVRGALHLNQGNSWILRQVKDIIAKGDYPALQLHRGKHERGFIWDETLDGSGQIITLHCKKAA